MAKKGETGITDQQRRQNEIDEAKRQQRDAENLKKITGRDPGTPLPGSEEWARQRGL